MVSWSEVRLADSHGVSVGLILSLIVKVCLKKNGLRELKSTKTFRSFLQLDAGTELERVSKWFQYFKGCGKQENI